MDFLAIIKHLFFKQINSSTGIPDYHCYKKTLPSYIRLIVCYKRILLKKY